MNCGVQEFRKSHVKLIFCIITTQYRAQNIIMSSCWNIQLANCLAPCYKESLTFHRVTIKDLEYYKVKGTQFYVFRVDVFVLEM